MSGHNPIPLAEFFFLGKDILVTILDAATNVLLAQIGDSTTSTPDSDAAEMWGPIGHWARPAKPTSGNASCQAIGIKGGNRDALIAYRDTRNSSIYGKLADGETCVGASTGQARTFWKADGSIQNVTTQGNAAGGTTFIVSQGSDGSFTIQAPAWIFKGDALGNITIGNAACGVTFDVTGKVHIFGTIVQAQASGVAMVSGDVSTLIGPKPVPTTPVAGPSSALVGLTGIAAVPSLNVFISPV